MIQFFRFSVFLFAVFQSGFVFAQEPEKTKNDTNREVIRTYARVYNEVKQFDKADEMITDYLTRESGDGELWILLGQTQLNERKFSQACSAFQKASAIGKGILEHVYADYNLADCLN